MVEKNLNIKTVIFLVIIIFVLGMGATLMYYGISKIAHVQNYDVRIETGEPKYIGFNADPTLDFGILPISGGSVKKELLITNEYDMPIAINIRVSGDVVPFIQITDNDFILNPKESRKIKVGAHIPSDFGKIAVFTGNLKVSFLRT
ncbi:hypothetical protein HQ545_08940 [Candidatus Woesearchaeota archaeon]|nr:hypothetical protein [Candidatus Woesearchaeota archaeon]